MYFITDPVSAYSGRNTLLTKTKFIKASHTFNTSIAITILIHSLLSFFIIVQAVGGNIPY